jgi:hypothetical protein
MHATKPEHGSFSSSKRQMGTLDPIVQISTCPLLRLVADVPHRGTVGCRAISDDDLRIAVALHRFLQESQGSSFVT